MNELTKEVISKTIFFVLAMAVMFFLPAWSLGYWQAWIFLLIFGGWILYIDAYLLKHDKALLQRRLKAGAKDETLKAQKIIQLVANIFFIALILIPGFDFHFHWTAVPVWLVLASDIFVFVGMLIIYLVFKENSFTSGIIEVDTEQKVISTGPYSLVRHPMYAGAFLLLPFTALALGSYVALIPAFLMFIIIVIRLLNEEKFLSQNLPGYLEYCTRVKYRLVPGVW